MHIFTIMLSLTFTTRVQSFTDEDSQDNDAQLSQEIESDSENSKSEKGLFESFCEYITENTVTNPDFGKDISDR